MAEIIDINLFRKTPAKSTVPFGAVNCPLCDRLVHPARVASFVDVFYECADGHQHIGWSLTDETPKAAFPT